jgi:hypothetical protein
VSFVLALEEHPREAFPPACDLQSSPKKEIHPRKRNNPPGRQGLENRHEVLSNYLDRIMQAMLADVV